MLDGKTRPIDLMNRSTPAQGSTPQDVRLTDLETRIKRLESVVERLDQENSYLREIVENLP